MKNIFLSLREKARADNYNTIKIFLFSLIINLIGLLVVNIISNGLVMDAMFGSDSRRVFNDMTLREYNHYRATVHPLFVIFTQPPIFLLSRIISKMASAVILNALIGAISATVFYLILKKIKLNKKQGFIFSLVFLLSFAQIVFNSIFETYIFAQFGLLLMWFIFFYLFEKKLEFWHYFLLILAGVLAMAFTVTNFVQFLIGLFVLIFFGKEKKNIISRFLVVVFLALCVGVFLSQIQNIIWPSAPEFFKSNLKGLLIDRNSEEFLYIEKGFSLHGILNQIKTSTIHQFAIFGNFRFQGFGFSENLFINLLTIIMFAGFILINFLFILSKKREFPCHKIYLAILMSYLFNFILHIFYGPSEAFLYSLNYNFLIFLLIAYIFINTKEKDHLFIVKQSIQKHSKLLLALYLVLQIYGIFRYLISTHYIFGANTNIPLSIFIIVSLSTITLSSLLFRNKRVKIISSLLSGVFMISLFFGYNYINNHRELSYIRSLDNTSADYKVFLNLPEVRPLVLSLARYYEELDIKLKKDLAVYKWEDTDKKYSDFFLFGLVDRKKILYRNGQLIDYKTKNIIKEWKIKHSLIIPNLYTVLLLDHHDNLIKIYEDESGVFVVEKNKTELITSGKAKFNLPDFHGKKYENILRVVLQETLFNFDGYIPKPNILAYEHTGGWYRDSMLVTMVFELTNNTHLLEEWVSSLTDIYDYQRTAGLKEADNPGELLYILGAVKNNRKDLIEKIIKEVETKAVDGIFSGMVDGAIMDYYPTALLINGAKKAKINFTVPVILPSKPDPYTPLTWWYKGDRVYHPGEIKSKLFPYLEWGAVHYQTEHLGIVNILDESYPLSYEADISEEFAMKQSYISPHYSVKGGPQMTHAWHASEIFLLLHKY